MAEDQTNRRLAAILAADVVGYSRMMGADEAGTLTNLKRHRETVFDPEVAAHKLVSHGRYVAFQMAEVAVTRMLFAEILRLIAELRPQPPPAPA